MDIDQLREIIESQSADGDCTLSEDEVKQVAYHMYRLYLEEGKVEAVLQLWPALMSRPRTLFDIHPHIEFLMVHIAATQGKVPADSRWDPIDDNMRRVYERLKPFA